MDRIRFALAIALLALAPAHGQSSKASTRAAATNSAATLRQKLEYLKQNSERPKPDQRPTTITEDEINSYLASGDVRLPPGTERIIFRIAPGNVSSEMTVNFDELTAHSSNPLLALFSGTHQVLTKAHGEGYGGMAHAHIDSVALDGAEVPRFILELFVQRMLRPKYPQASLDPTFKLPEKIDMAVLGQHKITITQK